MKEIQLTQGKVALVDDEDYNSVSQLKWYAKKDSCNFYAARNIKINGKRTTQRMHQFIIGSVPNSMLIDHIDGDGLNNQRFNFRICTCKQNQMNSKIRKNKNCQFKGVTFSKRDKVFIARITIDKKRKTIGRFDNELEAAIAYDKYASLYFGSFAKTNGLQSVNRHLDNLK